jgi:hypothetical protein
MKEKPHPIHGYSSNNKSPILREREKNETQKVIIEDKPGKGKGKGKKKSKLFGKLKSVIFNK